MLCYPIHLCHLMVLNGLPSYSIENMQNPGQMPDWSSSPHTLHGYKTGSCSTISCWKDYVMLNRKWHLMALHLFIKLNCCRQICASQACSSWIQKGIWNSVRWPVSACNAFYSLVDEGGLPTHFLDPMHMLRSSGYILSGIYIYRHEAREIMYLVACVRLSVRPSVCPTSHSWY